MATSDAGVVTPEAVVLDFQTAGVGSRILAALIDVGLQLAMFLVVVTGAAVLGKTPFGLAGVFFALFVISFGYPVACETLWRGRTVGKVALGLRVVTVEGAPERLRHAVIRCALGLLDLWVSSGGVAILTVLATPRNQRLGDLVAGTIVVRERTGARQSHPVAFGIPPGWEAYAGSLDVSGLTAQDYQAVRAFLLRAGSLDPMTRDRLARTIATPLLGRLRHQPPAGVPAEALLACVAAVYQQRQRAAVSGSPPSEMRASDVPPSGFPRWDRPREPTQQGDDTSAPLGGQPAPKEPNSDPGGFVAPG